MVLAVKGQASSSSGDDAPAGARSFLIAIPISPLSARMGKAGLMHQVHLHDSPDFAHFEPSSTCIGILGVPQASLKLVEPSSPNAADARRALVLRIASACGIAVRAMYVEPRESRRGLPS